MPALAKSHILALLVGVGALTACPPENAGDTGQTDDTSSDTEVDRDTGMAFLTITGGITTTDGAYTSGTLGFAGFGVIENDYICGITGALAYEGPAPNADSCPGCEWTFDLGPIASSVVQGPYCDALIDPGVFVAGAIDGYWDWSWGFASSYTYYDADGNPYDLQETLFVDSGEGWKFFMFNWAEGPVTQIEGDGRAFSFQRALTDSTGMPSYYYYYYR